MSARNCLSAAIAAAAACSSAPAQAQDVRYPYTDVCMGFKVVPGNRRITQFSTFADADEFYRNARVVHSDEEAGTHYRAFRSHMERIGASIYGCYTEERVRQIIATETPAFALLANGRTVSLGDGAVARATPANARSPRTPQPAGGRLPSGCFTFRRVAGVGQIYNGCTTDVVVAFCHTTPGTLYTCPQQGIAGPLAPGRAEAVKVPQGTTVRMNACTLASYHASACMPKVR